MKKYVCEILSQSEDLIQSEHDNFFEAIHRCIHASLKDYVVSSKVFEYYSGGLRQIASTRTLK